MHVLIIPSQRYLPEDDNLHGIFQNHQAHAIKNFGIKVGIISQPEMMSARFYFTKNKWPNPGFKVIDDQNISTLKYFGWYWIPKSNRARKWLWIRAWEKIFKKYIKLYGFPDIIHAHNVNFAGIFSAKLKQKYNIPFVITEHSSTYARDPISENELIDISYAYKYADERIVVSPGLGMTLENVIGSVVKPYHCIPNILENLFEKSQLPKNTNNNLFTFLNIGSLISIKGHEELLHAFAMKFKNNMSVCLRIGGDGILKEKLIGITKNLGISQQVKFLGYLSRQQVLKEMQNCNVYVKASHIETFGVVLIEALSCGKPIISTKCGGPESIVNQSNGILVPLLDINAMADAMEKIKQNISTYNAELIREDCINRFGAKAIVEQLKNVYNIAIKNNTSIKGYNT